jgi:hypothetical protein
MTRGRCGSLLLHRKGLAPSTPCRSPGASHKFSGLPPATDIRQRGWRVGSVPHPDIPRRTRRGRPRVDSEQFRSASMTGCSRQAIVSGQAVCASVEVLRRAPRMRRVSGRQFVRGAAAAMTLGAPSVHAQNAGQSLRFVLGRVGHLLSFVGFFVRSVGSLSRPAFRSCRGAVRDRSPGYAASDFVIDPASDASEIWRSGRSPVHLA